ncbi:MAG: helix-turn-helix domain-containing protein [Paracoccus sp. (in: a-proteobacteria)]
MANNAPELLTFEEAAALLHSAVKVSTLQRARRSDLLWAKKIGNRYFTTHQAVMEYLQCPEPENQPASISAKTKCNGSSATEAFSDGQGMLAASVRMLRKR